MGQDAVGCNPPTPPRGRIIGYARVSKDDQDLNLQIDALKKGGCRGDRIFVDKVSGARSQRPGLEACLKALKAGDVLLVWRLDRLKPDFSPYDSAQRFTGRLTGDGSRIDATWEIAEDKVTWAKDFDLIYTRLS